MPRPDRADVYSSDDLQDAVDHGIFAPQDVARFKSHVATRRQTSVVDDERFRLISGFNDVFVVIACILTLVSTLWIGASLSSWVSLGATAAVSWGLAECFVRRRRMALPGIILMLAFTGCCVALSVVLMVGDVFGSGPLWSGSDGGPPLFTALGVTALAAWLHWLRFRVPLAVAVCTAALLTLAALLILSFLSDGDAGRQASALDRFGGLVFFACGVAAFALAMRWDMRDPTRQTEKSDTAFWLHLLAAPLLVHPVFSAMTLQSADGVTVWQALSVVALYLGIAVVSLAIDRRALMVASLSYVLVVFANLLMQYGMVNMNFALTALVVGAALLVLSGYWHRMRAVVMRRLPEALTRRLPTVQ